MCCLQVRLLLAEAAAAAQDWPAALAFVMPLAEEGYAPAWPTAAAVAREGSASLQDGSGAERLLAFAIAHCGQDEVWLSLVCCSQDAAWCAVCHWHGESDNVSVDVLCICFRQLSAASWQRKSFKSQQLSLCCIDFTAAHIWDTQWLPVRNMLVSMKDAMLVGVQQ